MTDLRKARTGSQEIDRFFEAVSWNCLIASPDDHKKSWNIYFYHGENLFLVLNGLFVIMDLKNQKPCNSDEKT